jgi:hypothetical protein
VGLRHKCREATNQACKWICRTPLPCRGLRSSSQTIRHSRPQISLLGVLRWTPP